MKRIALCVGASALCAALISPAWSAPITNVVETGGDNEATDTITAKWTGQTFPVSVANEPNPGATVGTNYTVGTFGHLAPAYVDRNHAYANDPTNSLPIPAYLVGKDYIIPGQDNRDNATYRLDVTVSSPSTVYILIDNRLSDATATNPPTFDATHMQWILNEGWLATSNGLNRTANAAVPDEVGIDEASDGTINQYFSVYRRNVPAGTFALLQPENGGQNMYGVVVAAIPEPATGTLGLAALLGLVQLRRRRS